MALSWEAWQGSVARPRAPLCALLGQGFLNSSTKNKSANRYFLEKVDLSRKASIFLLRKLIANGERARIGSSFMDA